MRGDALFAERDCWIEAVSGVCQDIVSWSEARQWTVLRDEKTVKGDVTGPYTVPYLMIQTPEIRLHVDPIGYDIVGADGRVDIEAWPSLNRMLLLRRGGEWKLYTDSRIKWPEPWGERAFERLVEALSES